MTKGLDSWVRSVYNEKQNSTIFHYCCKNSGPTEKELVFPVEQPFYLFAFKDDICPKVGCANVCIFGTNRKYWCW
jgi:hypothetical protein